MARHERSHRRTWRRSGIGRRLSTGVCLAALATLGGASSANAATAIEGVWSFNGGEVAITPQANGTLTGTVVAPTKFAQCVHPVGEQVWTSITPQSDGSYWGFHQWYFATEECVPNPMLGLTAWRVLPGPEGSHFLRVCFSEPGSTPQPTISAEGVASDDTYGCEDSARVSALPGNPEVGLPSAPAAAGAGAPGCVAARRLHLRLRAAPHDPFKSVSVRLRSGNVSRRGKLHSSGAIVRAQLNLVGLPQPEFTVSVHARTVLGREIRRKHTYNVCALHRRSPKRRH